jgi:hypothetical protein
LSEARKTITAGPIRGDQSLTRTSKLRIRIKSRPKPGRKLQRGDRAHAEHARRLDQEKALDNALENTFPASDPVSIVQPAPPAADFDSVKSRRTHGTDEREAFWAAVYKFRAQQRNPALPDQPTIEVKGKRLTIRQVCELVKDIPDELPYIIAGEMVKAMQGDHRLIQLFALSRTYATGSQCLLKLLADYTARQQDKLN